MKKLSLFLFTLGLSAAFGYAHANGDPECYFTCDANYDACIERGASPAICTKIYDSCYARCDYEPNG